MQVISTGVSAASDVSQLGHEGEAMRQNPQPNARKSRIYRARSAGGSFWVVAKHCLRGFNGKSYVIWTIGGTNQTHPRFGHSS
jgi:hypothetical protein